jgi:hypothetical protein
VTLIIRSDIMRAGNLNRWRRMSVPCGLALTVATALALQTQPGVAQTRLSKAGDVTLQVVARDPSQLADGVLLLGSRQRAELELRATEASGQVLELGFTRVSWQASHPDLIQVKAAGSRAVVTRLGEGEAMVTVGALGNTLTLRAPAPTVAATQTAGAPSTVATIDPIRLRTNTPVATRDLCATGTPDPSWGQPCIRRVWPDSVARGGTILIKGTGFAGGYATVGGARMPTAQSDTAILVPVSGSMTDGSIVVTNPSSGRTASASVKIVRPFIVSFIPMEGRAGDRVLISGYGFLSPRPGIAFRNGQNPAANEYLDVTGTLVTAYVPPGDVTGHIWAVGPVSAEEFIELASFDPPSPADDYVLPTGTVTVSGTALQNVTEVVFGGQPQPIISKSYTRLTFGFSPALQQAQSSITLGRANFSYRVGGGGTRVTLAGPNVTLRVPPQIHALDPDSGYACGAGRVRGRALISAPPGVNTQAVVRIGNVQAPVTHATDTDVGFAVPKDATTGPVTVRGYSQQVVSSTPFRIVAPQPTATLQSAATPIQPGSTLQFVGRLQEVT